MTDRFGTAEIRRRVLAGWTASPARFREDANAEEDFARTGYRDRLVVELAQNAADAAARAGIPGRLLLRLDSDVLTAANTGAGLDAAGVEALSTLRASGKRDDDQDSTVGRFGVGFAAVLAVTDDPAIESTTGAVSWHLARTVAEVAAIGSLVGELDRRGGSAPILRLPWSDELPARPNRRGRAVHGADDAPADSGADAPDLSGDDVFGSYDTVVRLPLRDRDAFELARRLLAEVDAGLLLMLPALVEVVVEDPSRPVPPAGTGTGDGRRRVLAARDLDVRQVARTGRLDAALLADRPAEERRTRTWSVRWAVPRPPAVAAVVHAPTPTDEPLDLPGLLLASFPLDPSRRHVAAGPLRDFLVGQAAGAYVDLVEDVARAQQGPAPVLELVPGPLAAGALDAELRHAIVSGLVQAPILAGGLRPDSAVAVDGLPAPAFAVLAEVVPGLLPAAWAGRRELDRLGVRRTRLADLVDDLAALARPASWWHGLYEALSGADREALSGLPVPLADGRVVRGPRSVVVGAGQELADALAVLGLRVAEPAACHPLLERLGARNADPVVLLDDPTVRARVQSSMDEEDPEPVAAAVLHLVQATGGGAAEMDWLAALALPDDEGQWTPAGELLLPRGALASLLEPGALGFVDAGWATRFGPAVLAAVGVLAGFAVVSDQDVAVDPDLTEHDLDGEDQWLEELGEELGRGDVDRPGAEHRPGPGSGPGAVVADFRGIRDLDLVAADRWPAALAVIAADPRLRACVVEPARLVRPDGRSVDVPSYTAWWLSTHAVLDGRRPSQLHAAGLGDVLGGLLAPVPDLGLDEQFLAAIGVVTSVADLAGSPMVVPLLRAGVDPTAAVPAAGGSVLAVPPVAARVLPEAAATYVEHDDLRVGGVSCDWWVSDDGTVHAATTDGLARGLAWSADQWDLRLLLAAVLAEPGRADELLGEQAWS